MSKDDYETGQTLITPHIEIGEGVEPSRNSLAYVNVDTFRGCLGELTLARSEQGPQQPESSFYSVYGVVSLPVRSVDGSSYVNIDEPPVSRTLMGYLEESVLREKLPTTYQLLKRSK